MSEVLDPEVLRNLEGMVSASYAVVASSSPPSSRHPASGAVYLPSSTAAHSPLPLSLQACPLYRITESGERAFHSPVQALTKEDADR